MVIKMYSKGVTTREIADMVERMYGHYYSPTTVSNITKRTEHLVEESPDGKVLVLFITSMYAIFKTSLF
ncbi:hypothetical protein IV46_GL000869 [Limosilactobacillus fermentum]|nr:hypothetical protein IV46_GL000869 [Limosilactobacillus fermentum]